MNMHLKIMAVAISLLIFLFPVLKVTAQTGKFDTTVKMNDQGYRVECNNKNADQNDVKLISIGLPVNNTIPSFKVQGKVLKALIDDMNDDGLPDLAICVYSGTNNELGAVMAISYNADKSFQPIYFPDIYLDAKIRDGYKGHDEFSNLTGTLLRKFPIYLPGDTTKPTGGIRTVQYKAMMDNGHLSFKVLRSFDVKQ